MRQLDQPKDSIKLVMTEAKAKIKAVYRQLQKDGFAFIQLDQLHHTIIEELTEETTN